MNPQNVQMPSLFVVCHPYLQASLVVDITTRLGELSVENYDGDVIAQFTPAAREEMEASVRLTRPAKHDSDSWRERRSTFEPRDNVFSQSSLLSTSFIYSL
jgi:hypothetical protein